MNKTTSRKLLISLCEELDCWSDDNKFIEQLNDIMASIENIKIDLKTSKETQ